MNDPYDLQRFIDAQNPVFEQVNVQSSWGHSTSLESRCLILFKVASQSLGAEGYYSFGRY